MAACAGVGNQKGIRANKSTDAFGNAVGESLAGVLKPQQNRLTGFKFDNYGQSPRDPNAPAWSLGSGGGLNLSYRDYDNLPVDSVDDPAQNNGNASDSGRNSGGPWDEFPAATYSKISGIRYLVGGPQSRADSPRDNRALINALEKKLDPDWYATYPSKKQNWKVSPHLTWGDVGDYYINGGVKAAKSLVSLFTDDIPNLVKAVGSFIDDPLNSHPLDALEKGGLQMQDQARKASLAARDGNFAPAGELQGDFVGKTAGGTVFGLGSGALLGKTVQLTNGFRAAKMAAKEEAAFVSAMKIENNFGADGGYIPPHISIFGVPGGVGTLADYAHPYFYTGHVGFSFDDGSLILGQGPFSKNKNIPQIIDSLKDGDVYPGVITDDTRFFQKAAESQAKARNGLGQQQVYKLDMPVTRPQFELAQKLTASRGVNSVLPEFTYSFKTAGACRAPYNCATYPSSLGLPIPLNSGAISKYIPAMINQGATKWVP